MERFLAAREAMSVTQQSNCRAKELDGRKVDLRELVNFAGGEWCEEAFLDHKLVRAVDDVAVALNEEQKRVKCHSNASSSPTVPETAIVAISTNTKASDTSSAGEGSEFPCPQAMSASWQVMATSEMIASHETAGWKLASVRPGKDLSIRAFAKETNESQQPFVTRGSAVASNGNVAGGGRCMCFEETRAGDENETNTSISSRGDAGDNVGDIVGFEALPPPPLTIGRATAGFTVEDLQQFASPAGNDNDRCRSELPFKVSCPPNTLTEFSIVDKTNSDLETGESWAVGDDIDWQSNAAPTAPSELAIASRAFEVTDSLFYQCRK